MRKNKVNRLIAFAAACIFSVSAVHMRLELNTAFSAENVKSITADSIIPDGLYSIKNVNSGKYLSQRYGNVLQLSSPKAWRLTNQPDGSDFAACTFSISPDGIIPSVIKGDVNADGEFNISDLVFLQKWLLASPDTKLKNWQAGDICEDNRLDVFDLCLMRRDLVSVSEQY